MKPKENPLKIAYNAILAVDFLLYSYGSAGIPRAQAILKQAQIELNSNHTKAVGRALGLYH